MPIINAPAVQPKCRHRWAQMRCELDAGHLIANPPVPHAHEEWRWNSKIQWKVSKP